MINAILTGIINIILFLVNLILLPIDALISTLLPDLSNALASVAVMFDYALSYIGFAIDMTGLSDLAIGLIVSYWVFKLSAPLVVSTIKTALNWYRTLKP